MKFVSEYNSRANQQQIIPCNRSPLHEMRWLCCWASFAHNSSLPSILLSTEPNETKHLHHVLQDNDEFLIWFQCITEKKREEIELFPLLRYAFCANFLIYFLSTCSLAHTCYIQHMSHFSDLNKRLLVNSNYIEDFRFVEIKKETQLWRD